jgi:hypothetical protein
VYPAFTYTIPELFPHISCPSCFRYILRPDEESNPVSGSGMVMNPAGLPPPPPPAASYNGNRFLEEGEAAPSHSGLVEETDYGGDVTSSPRHHFALACAPSSSGSFMLASSFQVLSSVADPDPSSDPYVFGPPESGSVCQRYGSESFYHQAKIASKILIPTVFL